MKRPDSAPSSRARGAGLLANGRARIALSVARISLAIYFLLSATNLVSDPVIRLLFDAYSLATPGLELLKGSVIMAATLVLYGVATRPAALYLAVFLIWSAGLQAHGGLTEEQTGAMIGALALFAAMVLIAIDAPESPRPRRRRAEGRVRPRRIAPKRAAPLKRAPRGLPRPDRPASVSRADLDETPNIFADIWEEERA
ncbi:MAG: hypothetical protein D6811_00590 [Alphaproteobacteria bacterium]|nr:MAG: hypothetical protein D6811_00590 [Alphaproteobacteria bacterium]